MNITVEKTLEMPNAVLFARQLDVALKKEQKKRQHFYSIIDENKKMEFINGEVYFQSPVKLRHNSAMLALAKLLHTYTAANKLGYVGVEKLLVSLTRNDYEPDVCFFNNEKAKKFKPAQMQFPAPDLVVEVLSKTTEVNDRGIKFTDYAAHGVSEYWIVDPESETLEQYILKDGEYELLIKSKDGMVESKAAAGFKIPVRAIFSEKDNLKTLQGILSSSK
jgi:Uma2 family endonuclease